MSTFGVPITDETLNQMPRYKGIWINQKDRAREAMRLIHAEDKHMAALNHALDQQKAYKYGGATAMVLVYNATGGVLELVEDQRRDWHGYEDDGAPASSFQNGQWIAFNHVDPASVRDNVRSMAARVYRGRNYIDEVCDFLVAWNVRWSSVPNSVYTEVREEDHFPRYWDYIEGLLGSAGKVARDDLADGYCASTIGVGGSYSAECIAVLQHKFSPLPHP